MKKQPTIHMIRTHKDAVLPLRAHETDAAWDIFTPETIELAPGERKRVSTGWKIGIVPNKVFSEKLIDDDIFQDDMLRNDLYDLICECDENYFVWQIEVRPRSGNAIKHGVTLANSPGTVDNPYRGPFDIILVNHGQEAVVFQKGDRIAQMVLTKAYICDVVESEKFPDQTDRGEGGFGHTGK